MKVLLFLVHKRFASITRCSCKIRMKWSKKLDFGVNFLLLNCLSVQHTAQLHKWKTISNCHFLSFNVSDMQEKYLYERCVSLMLICYATSKYFFLVLRIKQIFFRWVLLKISHGVETNPSKNISYVHRDIAYFFLWNMNILMIHYYYG